MKYFSMFSGIGGFELGIDRANTRRNSSNDESISSDGTISNSADSLRRTSHPICVGYSEIDKYAIQIYEKHFKGHKNYGDCSRIKWKDVENFELLVGGFPCQSFSIAGKRHGFSDTRGTLFFEIARCLREKQPHLFLIENVKGLLSHDKGNTMLTILTTLDELGYDCQWQVLNSKNFGVPQNRERVFIVGHLRGKCRPKIFPFGQSDELSNSEIQSRRRSTNENRIASTITQNYKRGVHSGGETYVGEGYKIRRLTPTECERLQGFPDGWTNGISDTQRYKCLGNAVTVNVIEAIMERML